MVKDNPLVFAVIPTFNRVGSLKKCIESLFEQTAKVARIVVVDSDSSDGTRQMLSEYGGMINLVAGTKDWWWGKCMNEGISYALEQGADYILAMNDDTSLDRYSLQFLLETNAFIPGSIVGGIVVDQGNDGKIINEGVGARYSKFRWLPLRRVLFEDAAKTIYYTEGQSGRGVLFPRAVYEKIGLYDDLNFPQHADRDFSYRCLKAGIPQCLDSRARTFLNFSTTQIGMNENKLKFADLRGILFHVKGIYNIKNQYRFLRKHYLMWPVWMVVWFCLVGAILTVRLLPGGTETIRRFTAKLFLWGK